MEINAVHQLFDLSRAYQNWDVQYSKQKFLISIKLLDDFSVMHSTELSKLPYRLNLLDDLSTNENAHSKFLIRLLQYKPALLSFIKFVNENGESFDFDIRSIKHPILTWEKMRIDGLIIENNKYAIIIENKIHNAVEQEHQVGRYIEKCKSIGFKIEQIFVLYLTKTENDFQSHQSWGVQYTFEDFKTRYSKLSYRSHILPWLEQYLKILGKREELIKSALVQYIDHLKHFFNKKEIYTNMNSELQKFLSDELEFTSDKVENVEIVTKKVNELNNLSAQLNELMKSAKYQLFEEWKNQIKDRFDFDDSQVFFYEDPSHIKSGVKLEFKGYRFSILIEHNTSSTYFGFGRHDSSEIMYPEIREFLNSIIDKESLKPDNYWWYGWKYTNFRDAFVDFEFLLKVVLDKLKSTK